MSTAHIRISDDRAEQLRALAEVRRSTIAGLIDELVTSAMVAGELPDATPGIGIIRSDDGQVTLTVEGVALPPLPPGELADFAPHLENPKRRLLAILDERGDTTAEVGHVGKAVELKVKHAGAEARKVMTPSVARDLARQLRAVNA